MSSVFALLAGTCKQVIGTRTINLALPGTTSNTPTLRATRQYSTFPIWSFAASESAIVTDGVCGRKLPTDDDWRFDRVDPTEWGRGCREEGRPISEDEHEEEEKAYRRVRANWSAATSATGRARVVGGSASQDRGGRGHWSLKPSAQVESRHDGDAHMPWGPQQHRVSAASCVRATSEGNLTTRGRHQHRRPFQHRRHKSQTTPGSPGMMRRARRSGGWVGESGGGGANEEEFGGWCSAPEDSNGGVGGGRRKPHSVRGAVSGNLGTGADWRTRGALGRRPASREAARQLRVSERLHRLAQVMAKKKERARRRRDDLQQARVSEAVRERIAPKSRSRSNLSQERTAGVRVRSLPSVAAALHIFYTYQTELS